MRNVLGVEAFGRGVDALFEAGPVLRGVGGQEAGKARELDEGEQAAGASSSRTFRRARPGRAMWCIEADAHTRSGVPRSGQRPASRSACTVCTRPATPRAHA